MARVPILSQTARKDGAPAKTYWIALGTLRDWEQRRKNADRPAQGYLMVIEKDPAVVAALLARWGQLQML